MRYQLPAYTAIIVSNWPHYPTVNVITDSTSEFNIKPRLVYCLHCKYTTMTDKAGPRCGACKQHLITHLG